METASRRVTTPRRRRAVLSSAAALLGLLTLAPPSLEAGAPASAVLHFSRLPSRAVAGQAVTVSVAHARANALCSLAVNYGTSSTQPGLAPKTAVHGGPSGRQLRRPDQEPLSERGRARRQRPRELRVGEQPSARVVVESYSADRGGVDLRAREQPRLPRGSARCQARNRDPGRVVESPRGPRARRRQRRDRAEHVRAGLGR